MPAGMSERDPPARQRQSDLARVQMAREDEVEGARRQPVEHVWKVTEKNAQVGIRIGEACRLGLAAPVGARVDPDDLDPATVELERVRLVEQKPRATEGRDGQAVGKRVATRAEVVVAQDGRTARQPLEQLPEQ